jgi:hypothetical protein
LRPGAASFVALRGSYPRDELLVWRGPVWRDHAAREGRVVLAPLAISADGAPARQRSAGLAAFDLDTGRVTQVEVDIERHGDVSALAAFSDGSAVVVGTERGRSCASAPTGARRAS